MKVLTEGHKYQLSGFEGNAQKATDFQDELGAFVN